MAARSLAKAGYKKLPFVSLQPFKQAAGAAAGASTRRSVVYPIFWTSSPQQPFPHLFCTWSAGICIANRQMGRLALPRRGQRYYNSPKYSFGCQVPACL